MFFSFMFDGVPYVAVDTSKTAERVRFDIAHEIGHLMMHEMVSEDAAAAGMRDIEGEAHSFAANLLMREAPCSGHGADSCFSVADFGRKTLFQGFRNGHGSPCL